MKDFGLDFPVEPKQAEIYTWKNKIANAINFCVTGFLCIILGACYIEATKTSKCAQCYCHKIDLIKTNEIT